MRNGWLVSAWRAWFSALLSGRDFAHRAFRVSVWRKPTRQVIAESFTQRCIAAIGNSRNVGVWAGSTRRADEARGAQLCLPLVCMIMLPATPQAAETPKPRQSQQQPATTVTSTDRSLARQVARTLRARDNIRINGLDVVVDTGIATLHGEVATSAEKHLASRYAQDIDGVQGVVNALRVNPARQPPD